MDDASNYLLFVLLDFFFATHLLSLFIPKLKIGISRLSKIILWTEYKPKAMYYRNKANMNKQYTHITEHFNQKLRTQLSMPALGDPLKTGAAPIEGS